MARKVKKGLPPWMATFSDLCTLLLTFFVLLLTFANLDLKKFQDMLGSVKQAFGVQVKERGQFQPVKPKARPVVEHQRRHIMTQFAPTTSAQDAQAAAEASQMARRIRDMSEKDGLGNAVDITAGTRGVRMRVKGALLFEPGQAEIKSGANKLLVNVAKVMDKFHFYLTVEGHTDATPIHTAQFPSNWELSAARASAVLRYLTRLGVPQTRMSAVGYASNYPLASNDTEEGRNQNRRVEFIFTKKPLRVGVD